VSFNSYLKEKINLNNFLNKINYVNERNRKN